MSGNVKNAVLNSTTGCHEVVKRKKSELVSGEIKSSSPREIKKYRPENDPHRIATDRNCRFAKLEAIQNDHFLSLTAVALETESATCDL